MLAIACIFSLLSCFGEVAGEGGATVVIEDIDGYDVYTVDLSKINAEDRGALAILEYLSENEGMSLDYVDSTYGGYVNAIGSLAPSAAANEYVAIYTSEEADFGVAPFDTKAEYDGMTLTASGVGISSMTVRDGTVILFRIESY